jgi:hypothetical protein
LIDRPRFFHGEAKTIPEKPLKKVLDLFQLLMSHTAVHITILIAASLWITCKDISLGDFRNPDAWSHAMNGVYLLDLVKQMPLNHFWDFTLSYYAKYPAISLPYHPPGLPIVEALFFAVLGISPAVARFAVMCCGSFGIIAWYGLARSTHGKAVALFSGLLLLTNPFFVLFSRQVMLEVPTLAMITFSIYCLHKALDSNSRAHLYWWAVAAGASVWFKQSALFVLPLALTYFLLRRRRCKLPYRDLLLSMAIAIVAIIPVMWTTWYYGRSAYRQAFVATGPYVIAKSSMANWLYYFHRLPDLVPAPFLVAASVSIALLAWKKRWDSHLIYLLWIIFAYAFVSYISVKEIRYAFFLIPPFYLLACSITEEIQFKIKTVKVATVLLGGICLFQSVSAYHAWTPVLSGFDQAAKYVIENWKGNTVLVSARYHGNFTFNVRRFDPDGKVMVLRAEKAVPKLLERSEKWRGGYLADALRTLGTRYVVVETLDWNDMPELTQLRNSLTGGDFALRRKIDIVSNMAKYQRASILIYEFLGNLDPTKEFIEMRMPKMRKRLKIPLQPYKEPLP